MIAFVVSLLGTSCSIFQPIPQPKSEFRGFWVATVVNIDWPRNGADPVEKQKNDFLEILDFYDDLNFNTAIVQVRTAGDAFYNSHFAPWSRFLTGTEGQKQEAHENLLTWMIRETHKRGMEFHAWLNPYRATFDLRTNILSPTHDFNLHPEWMVQYGKKYYYNPGLPEVRNRMIQVIDEIITNYDIDAIHFDDYFYPYTINDEVFQDSLSFAHHGLPNQSLEDWRRSNIDSLIKNSHEIIKARKPWVQFGVSPFGVWKNQSTDPQGSDTRAGQTTYENLFADPLLWMEKEWLDYLIPQVYWSMELPVASHHKIVDWWSGKVQNTNLYIGNGPYKIRNNSDKAWDDKKELPNQLTLARNTDAVSGNAFFSAKSLMKNNEDVVAILKKRHYKRASIPPASPLARKAVKSQISLNSLIKKNDTVYMDFDNLENYRYAMVYASGKRKRMEYPIKKLLAKIPLENRNVVPLPVYRIAGKKQMAFVFIDRYRRESEPIVVHLKR
ncbi:family 10 glycosylhydrolase [Flavobacteriaceae bacterium TP-CH-4]|uniref:Family 10 glycosylhydrolase n=1 Tax=Pelagihabitans pacificus TaxID=2696054 RepID=A0A967EF82_9FLAO|nr:family 10 glycosylhydrolase [Pelagihabitans pacificus]